MAPFVDLFHGQLQYATVYSAGFGSANVVALLRGIRDTPATYGLDSTAAGVAGAFVNAQGLIDIAGVPIAVDGMDIRDLGAALGYLLRQTVAQQNIETSYRPILHAYGRVLRAVSNKIAMSAVMFAPTTAPLWLFGATIPVLTPSHTSKSLIQADRLRQMRAALLVRGVALPPLPKQSLSGLAIQLANDKVPTQAQANLRNASPALLALYEELLVALVAESTGTYPITLTFKNNLTDFNAVRQRIVAAESPAWGQAVIAALIPDAAFRTYLHTTLANNPKPEFGHCAESFPFIRLLRGVATRTASQGLAMVPRKMVDLNGQQITAGTVSYNTIGTFRKPCPNCTQVLILAGMTENTFNTYISDGFRP